MSYTNPTKAIALAHEIADKLKLRLSALALVESFDTDGNPVIAVGPQTAGSASITIKVMPQDWSLAKDVIGQSANIYAPTIIQFGTEADYAGATDNVADPLTPAQLLAALGECLSRGCRLDWYQTATGTAPTIANTIFAAAKLKASFQPDLYNGLTSQQ